MSTTFRVFGPPATKGSTVSFLGDKGKVITKADCKTLAAWSQAVGWAARAARVKVIARPLPVAMTVTFAFLKPATSKLAHPTVKPDIDKVLRACLDSLTGVGFEDDSQVTAISAVKVYGSESYTEIEIGEFFGVACVKVGKQ